MSADTELRDVLLAYAPLVALVPASRIALDSVEAGLPRPFIVIAKNGGTPTFGLGDDLLVNTTNFTVQAVAERRLDAIAVRKLVEQALLTGGVPWTATSGGMDEQLGFETESVTLDWIE